MRYQGKFYEITKSLKLSLTKPMFVGCHLMFDELYLTHRGKNIIIDLSIRFNVAKCNWKNNLRTC